MQKVERYKMCVIVNKQVFIDVHEITLSYYNQLMIICTKAVKEVDDVWNQWQKITMQKCQYDFEQYNVDKTIFTLGFTRVFLIKETCNDTYVFLN